MMDGRQIATLVVLALWAVSFVAACFLLVGEEHP